MMMQNNLCEVMSKSKLVLFLVVLVILINGFAGCKNIQEEENLYPARTINQKQNHIENEVSRESIRIESPLNCMDSIKEYKKNLCTDDEEVLFSFDTSDSSKTLSVCVSKTQPDYIVYRFGTKDKIELEFPENKSDSWSKFTYSYYLRGGGSENAGMDMNYLVFNNDGYEYKIYQEYTAIDEITQVGLKITDTVGNKETDIKGLSKSIEGGLINLRGNSKINIQVQ